MRLVQKASILQVCHNVTNRRGAQRFFKTLRDRARGDRFSRLNVHAHDVRQNLAVTPFLEGWIPHSSTLLLVLKSATYIVESVSSGVNGSLLVHRRKNRKGRNCP